MKLTISQVLEMLAKANEIDLQPQIEIILDEYWIYFWGYDGDSIIITQDGTFKGYGWTYKRLMDMFDEKIKNRNDSKLTENLYTLDPSK